MEKIDRYRKIYQRSDRSPQLSPCIRRCRSPANFRYRTRSLSAYAYRLERLYGCIAHLDIKDGRIWIQYDGTETGIADELAELGVPKEDIVLAYHPPYKRPYTGFGPTEQ